LNDVRTVSDSTWHETRARGDRGSSSVTTRAQIGAVVVSYNSERDLGACLEALCAAEDLGGVVVVDNASGDGSREIVRGMGDPRITLVTESSNLGFAGGCNRGYHEHADAYQYLAFLNPDVVVSKDCFRRAIERLDGDDRLAAVAPRLMRSDGETVDSVGQKLHPLHLEVVDLGYGAPLSPGLLDSRSVIAPCGALAVFRRSALDEVAEPSGPWAQHFFCFWEDLEIGWRLVNLGWTISTCPEAVATHRRGAGASAGRGPLRWRRPPELEACIVSNRWMTLARHLHTLDLVPRLPLLLLWDTGLVAAGGLRRPALIGHLRQRWPMVLNEWRKRKRYRRRRLHELA
jgi:GT2 family glycosyltransferase